MFPACLLLSFHPENILMSPISGFMQIVAFAGFGLAKAVHLRSLLGSLVSSPQTDQNCSCPYVRVRNHPGSDRDRAMSFHPYPPYLWFG